MAFFSGGDDRTKLIIMYVIRAFRTSVTQEQLYTALCYTNGPGFFEMGAQYAALEEEGFIASVPVRNMQMLFLTAKGVKACDMFDKELPKSLRDAITAFADEKRDEYRRSNYIVADAQPLPGGGCMAVLAILERGEPIFEMRIRMPDYSAAYDIMRRWAMTADDTYSVVLERLAHGSD